ncbi:hypothetical protein WJX81_002748 [Elliptochloris bilobata]|uniref:Uncharacterized protein n=1 Tax=Elliptochloris bilobata TaxID=381761 RepID=A0AAW1RWH0_9CHLO
MAVAAAELAVSGWATGLETVQQKTAAGAQPHAADASGKRRERGGLPRVVQKLGGLKLKIRVNGKGKGAGKKTGMVKPQTELEDALTQLERLVASQGVARLPGKQLLSPLPAELAALAVEGEGASSGSPPRGYDSGSEGGTVPTPRGRGGSGYPDRRRGDREALERRDSREQWPRAYDRRSLERRVHERRDSHDLDRDGRRRSRSRTGRGYEREYRRSGYGSRSSERARPRERGYGSYGGAREDRYGGATRYERGYGRERGNDMRLSERELRDGERQRDRDCNRERGRGRGSYSRSMDRMCERERAAPAGGGGDAAVGGMGMARADAPEADSPPEVVQPATVAESLPVNESGGSFTAALPSGTAWPMRAGPAIQRIMVKVRDVAVNTLPPPLADAGAQTAPVVVVPPPPPPPPPPPGLPPLADDVPMEIEEAPPAPQLPRAAAAATASGPPAAAAAATPGAAAAAALADALRIAGVPATQENAAKLHANAVGLKRAADRMGEVVTGPNGTQRRAMRALGIAFQLNAYMQFLIAAERSAHPRTVLDGIAPARLLKQMLDQVPLVEAAVANVRDAVGDPRACQLVRIYAERQLEVLRTRIMLAAHRRLKSDRSHLATSLPAALLQSGGPALLRPTGGGGAPAAAVLLARAATGVAAGAPQGAGMAGGEAPAEHGALDLPGYVVDSLLRVLELSGRTLGSLTVMSRTGAELAAFVSANAGDAGAVNAAAHVALLSLDAALLPIDALAQHGRRAFAAVQGWADRLAVPSRA